MRNKKLTFAVVLGILIFSLCGCFGGTEVNQRAFVQLMGIEKNNDMYIVSLQLYSSQSGSGYPDITKSNAKTINGEGVTLYSALENAEIKQGKNFFLGHIKLIVIGNNIENPANELTVFLDSGISPGCPVAYSPDPSAVIATELEEGIFSAEYLLQLMDSSARHGETIFTPLTSIVSDVGILNLTCVLPILYSDGEKIHFDGLTFAEKSNAVPKAEILPDEVLGVKLLIDDFSKGDRITVPVTIGNKTASVVIVDSKTYKNADIYEGNLRMHAKINICIQITENPYGLDKSQIEKAVRENLNDTVISAFSTAVWYNNYDIFGIYKLIRKYCPEYISKYNTDKETLLEDSVLNIEINDRVIAA